MATYVGVWKKFVEFNGRASRTEYWTFVIVNTVLIFALGAISNLVGGGAGGSAQVPTSDPLFFVYIVFLVAAFLPGLAVAIRRLHDSGKSGLWFLIVLIPIIGQLAWVVLMLLDGQKEDNRYGPHPGHA